MFIKTGDLHLRTVFPIILVVKALHSQPRAMDSNLPGGFKESTLFQPNIPSKFIKWVPGTPSDWLVKSKLSPDSGSVAWR